MNIPEYISTGIVESYVLGLATEAERQEFETACRQHPEVLQARIHFEEALEKQLMQDVAPPPAAFKKKVLDALQNLDEPATETFSKPHAVPVRHMGFWKILAAASVVALVGTLVWAISLNEKNKTLLDQNIAWHQKAEEATAQLSEMKGDAQLIQSPTVKMAAMQGTPNAPAAYATVYWDTTTKDVYMLVNNMPQPASDKQYQLWALINNKPVDLGVFDVKQEKLLVKMKNVQNAQAFAVTLEPRGGSPAPTMSAMYVVGKL